MVPWLRRTLPAFGFALVILGPATARADADREKYDMGVVALRNKDCRAAADAFNSVEGPLAQDPSFVNYAAQANECAGDLPRALEYYRKKEVFDQDKLKAREKIGELLYRINKEKQAAAAANSQLSAQPAATPADNGVVVNPGGVVSGVVGGQTFSIPIGGGGTGLQNVKFAVADASQTFDLQVENADGTVNCKGVSYLKPCSVKVRTGPARVVVTSGASFTQNIEVPGSGCTVTVAHDGGHGYLIGGVALVGTGALLLVGGIKLDAQPETDGGGSGVFTALGAVYGGLAAGTGLIMILVDVYRQRDSATLTRSFGADSGFSPRLVGMAPVSDGHRDGAALVFEF